MLFHSDCLDFAKQQPEASYQLIIADPPYYGTLEANWDNQWKSEAEYLEWLKIRIAEFSRLLSQEGNLILYCKRQLLPQIHLICDAYLKEQRIIVWVRRRNMDVTRGKTLASGYEPILWYSKSDGFIFNSENAKTPPEPHLRHRKEYQKGGRLEKGVGLTDAWVDIPALPQKSKKKTSHPSQKPLALSERIVNLFSLKEGKVFVPFAGSGSEIIACEKLGRKWDATELNTEYVDLINERLKNHQEQSDPILEENET